MEATSQLRRSFLQIESELLRVESELEASFATSYSNASSSFNNRNASSSRLLNPLSICTRLRSAHGKYEPIQSALMKHSHAKTRLMSAECTSINNTNCIMNAIAKICEMDTTNMDEAAKKLNDVTSKIRMAHYNALKTHNEFETSPNAHAAAALDIRLLKAGILSGTDVNTPSPQQQQALENDNAKSDMRESSKTSTDPQKQGLQRRAAQDIRDRTRKTPATGVGAARNTGRENTGHATGTSARSLDKGTRSGGSSGGGSDGNGEASAAFVPVQKSAYNRLPRNLKCRAGKLDALNELYERVYGILKDASDGLHDEELMKLCEEPNIDRFEALRGLSVITHSTSGWQLVVPKAKAPPRARAVRPPRWRE